MTTIVVPAPTAAEQAAEDFDPIPRIAAALGSVRKTAYRWAHPSSGGWQVDIDITEEALFDGAFVSYSELTGATLLPFTRGIVRALPGDTMHISLREGR